MNDAEEKINEIHETMKQHQKEVLEVQEQIDKIMSKVRGNEETENDIDELIRLRNDLIQKYKNDMMSISSLSRRAVNNLENLEQKTQYQDMQENHKKMLDQNLEDYRQMRDKIRDDIMKRKEDYNTNQYEINQSKQRSLKEKEDKIAQEQRDLLQKQRTNEAELNALQRKMINDHEAQKLKTERYLFDNAKLEEKRRDDELRTEKNKLEADKRRSEDNYRRQLQDIIERERQLLINQQKQEQSANALLRDLFAKSQDTKIKLEKEMNQKLNSEKMQLQKEKESLKEEREILAKESKKEQENLMARELKLAEREQNMIVERLKTQSDMKQTVIDKENDLRRKMAEEFENMQKTRLEDMVKIQEQKAELEERYKTKMQEMAKNQLEQDERRQKQVEDKKEKLEKEFQKQVANLEKMKMDLNERAEKLQKQIAEISDEKNKQTQKLLQEKFELQQKDLEIQRSIIKAEFQIKTAKAELDSQRKDYEASRNQGNAVEQGQTSTSAQKEYIKDLQNNHRLQINALKAAQTSKIDKEKAVSRAKLIAEEAKTSAAKSEIKELRAQFKNSKHRKRPRSDLEDLTNMEEAERSANEVAQKQLEQNQEPLPVSPQMPTRTNAAASSDARPPASEAVNSSAPATNRKPPPLHPIDADRKIVDLTEASSNSAARKAPTASKTENNKPQPASRIMKKSPPPPPAAAKRGPPPAPAAAKREQNAVPLSSQHSEQEVAPASQQQVLVAAPASQQQAQEVALASQQQVVVAAPASQQQAQEVAPASKQQAQEVALAANQRTLPNNVPINIDPEKPDEMPLDQRSMSTNETRIGHFFPNNKSTSLSTDKKRTHDRFSSSKKDTDMEEAAASESMNKNDVLRSSENYGFSGEQLNQQMENLKDQLETTGQSKTPEALSPDGTPSSILSSPSSPPSPVETMSETTNDAESTSTPQENKELSNISPISEIPVESSDDEGPDETVLDKNDVMSGNVFGATALNEKMKELKKTLLTKKDAKTNNGRVQQMVEKIDERDNGFRPTPDGQQRKGSRGNDRRIEAIGRRGRKTPQNKVLGKRGAQSNEEHQSRNKSKNTQKDTESTFTPGQPDGKIEDKNKGMTPKRKREYDKLGVNNNMPPSVKEPQRRKVTGTTEVLEGVNGDREEAEELETASPQTGRRDVSPTPGAGSKIRSRIPRSIKEKRDVLIKYNFKKEMLKGARLTTKGHKKLLRQLYGDDLPNGDINDELQEIYLMKRFISNIPDDDVHGEIEGIKTRQKKIYTRKYGAFYRRSKDIEVMDADVFNILLNRKIQEVSRRQTAAKVNKIKQFLNTKENEYYLDAEKFNPSALFNKFKTKEDANANIEFMQFYEVLKMKYAKITQQIIKKNDGELLSVLGSTAQIQQGQKRDRVAASEQYKHIYINSTFQRTADGKRQKTHHEWRDLLLTNPPTSNLEYFVRITGEGKTSFDKMWTILENNYKNKIHGQDYDKFYSALIHGMANEIRQFANNAEDDAIKETLKKYDIDGIYFYSFLAKKWTNIKNETDLKILQKLNEISNDLLLPEAETKASNVQSVKFRF